MRRSVVVRRSGDPQPVECVPPLDVSESADTIDVVVDLPGVSPDAISVVMREGVLLITGTKEPSRCRSHAAAFHLAERSFGTFARAVHVAGAVDASRATVTLESGELRIRLPRVEERRGRDIRLPVGHGPA